ncbi:hypothetical protein F5146DRAFT_327424 [Armillaria mellea]|nr:hypothetical protein F5146DRAFT_327424 [Armillaria mellea]
MRMRQVWHSFGARVSGRAANKDNAPANEELNSRGILPLRRPLIILSLCCRCRRRPKSACLCKLPPKLACPVRVQGASDARHAFREYARLYKMGIFPPIACILRKWPAPAKTGPSPLHSHRRPPSFTATGRHPPSIARPFIRARPRPSSIRTSHPPPFRYTHPVACPRLLNAVPYTYSTIPFLKSTLGAILVSVQFSLACPIVTEQY